MKGEKKENKIYSLLSRSTRSRRGGFLGGQKFINICHIFSSSTYRPHYLTPRCVERHSQGRLFAVAEELTQILYRYMDKREPWWAPNTDNGHTFTTYLGASVPYPLPPNHPSPPATPNSAIPARIRRQASAAARPESS